MEAKVEKMDFESFRDALGDWGDKLRPFVESKGMFDIYKRIKEDAKNERIVPNYTDTFRAFRACRHQDVKVVFYLQDPYPRLYKKDGKLTGIPQATGIAMDCRNSPKGDIQPSLKAWYDAVDRFLPTDTHPVGMSRMDTPRKCLRDPNLDYLHEQGVIMLNTDLTCKLNKTGSHDGVWAAFQKYLLEEVMITHTGIIYVLCGDVSHRMAKYINPLGNYIFEIEHPHAGEHRGDKIWRDENIFHKINTILVGNNGYNAKIWWDKKDWDFYKDPPF